MSIRELARVGVMARVRAGTLSLTSAAEVLGISYRQAKRIYRRYRADGAAGLKHRSAGRRSNRATALETRRRALALIREKYSGAVDERFGPTLAAEHLATEDQIEVDHETLRRWMLDAGLWQRTRRRRAHRRRRERKAHFGELVQLDGSQHAWFETRGPTSCLLTLVDDATGRSLGRFSAQETIWAAVTVLRAWIETYGIPQALYTDWKNVYVRRPTEEEQLTQTVPVTQFGRMCAALGIQIIPASSPQAKGRIERNHGTHQDRLVKKLRRQGLSDLEAANAFLAGGYWTDHNRRFARPPTSADDFHRAPPPRRALDAIFRLEQTRTVANDWVVRYANRYFQIARQSQRPPARATVRVYEAIDGQIDIWYRDRRVRCEEMAAAAVQAQRRPPVTSPAAAIVTSPSRHGPWRPPSDHPWRQRIDREIQQRLAKLAPRDLAGTAAAQTAATAPANTTPTAPGPGEPARSQRAREKGTVLFSEERGHF
jgi:transposase